MRLMERSVHRSTSQASTWCFFHMWYGDDSRIYNTSGVGSKDDDAAEEETILLTEIKQKKYYGLFYLLFIVLFYVYDFY